MMVQLQFAIRYDGMHAVHEQAVTGDHKVYTKDCRLHADCNSLAQLVFKSQSVLKYGRLPESVEGLRQVFLTPVRQANQPSIHMHVCVQNYFTRL